MSQAGKSKAFNVGGGIAHGPVLEPPKQPVVLPSLQFTIAHFTRHEVELLRKVCRDSDYEDAGKVLAGAIRRGDGR